ncbi:hypothetical protein BG000_002372 [Podila horticola]|nr:hypothetical protein BG000_002372 [Podila horticola]
MPPITPRPNKDTSTPPPLFSHLGAMNTLAPSQMFSGALPITATPILSPSASVFGAPPAPDPRKYIPGELPNNLDDGAEDLRNLPTAEWCTRDPEFASYQNLSYEEAHSRNWSLDEQFMHVSGHPTRYLRQMTKGQRADTEDGEVTEGNRKEREDEREMEELLLEVPIRDTSARLVDMAPCRRCQEEGGLFVPPVLDKYKSYSSSSSDGIGLCDLHSAPVQESSSSSPAHPSTQFCLFGTHSPDLDQTEESNKEGQALVVKVNKTLPKKCTTTTTTSTSIASTSSTSSSTLAAVDTTATTEADPCQLDMEPTKTMEPHLELDQTNECMPTILGHSMPNYEVAMEPTPAIESSAPEESEPMLIPGMALDEIDSDDEEPDTSRKFQVCCMIA